MNTKKHFRDREVDIEYRGERFVGSSWAGVHTHIAIPRIKLAFDLGRATAEIIRCRDILVSHVHQDHFAGLPHHVAVRGLTGQSPSRIWLPSEHVELARDVLCAWDRLEGRQGRAEKVELQGVQDGDHIELGRGLFAEVFKVSHTLESVGYQLFRRRKTLKEMYRGLTGPEIGALVVAGEEVKEQSVEHFVTYIGDTRAEALDANAKRLGGRLLFLECTYLGRDRAFAGPRGHLHIDDIAERYELFTCDRLVLKHFSLKYNPNEIHDLVARALPPALMKKTTLMF